MLIRLYKHAALMLLNVVVLFLAANLLIWLFWRPTLPEPAAVAPPKVTLGSLNYDFDKLRQVYPELSDKNIIRMLLENWNLPLVCDEKTIFREQAFQGDFVNVDPAGFRRTKDQGPWPPDDAGVVVFVFGGSTTFGYGEMDNRSLPSFLQQHLQKGLSGKPVFVYNFGHGYYFSLQERLEFERLLAEGAVPNLAIFVDGLNEFNYWDNRPGELPCAAAPGSVTKVRNTILCQAGEMCWPIQRLASSLGEQIAAQRAAAADQGAVVAPPLDDVETNTAVIRRWLENKRLIEETAAQHNVATLFVIQPVPTFAYDLRYHLFAENLDELGPQARSHWGYPLWRQMIADDAGAGWTTNVVDLATMTEDRQEPLFVDRVHYTAPFASEIARTLAGIIIDHELITP